ncbi:MAG: hypothetical protein IVW53_01870 [Chloroflexi bacterium]|nr:hypothetical protein [Chloroflexota bacterium]
MFILGSAERHGSGRRHRPRSRGQVIVMFAGGLIFFIGLMAIVVDISWYWANTLRVQRAADAAALAGAVYLPGDVSSAKSYAIAEATKNGYTTGGGIAVTPAQDTLDPRQLDVTVSAPVGTFFMRVFGIDTITASRMAKAVYVQPVPMGSPENYYGIYCLTTPADRNCDSTTAVPNATGVGTLASKGFWGAFQSSGDVHNEGDAFMPYNDTLNPGTNPAGGTNPDYTGKGYDYAVEVPANGGSVYVFDPTFCPVGGSYGSGDHYNTDAGRQWGQPGQNYSMGSFYSLYNTNNTLFTTGDDTLVASSGSLFANEYQFDYSGKYGSPGFKVALGTKSIDGVAAIDCSDGKITNPAVGGYWHDRWWPIATNLPAGVYRLNVLSATVKVATNWKAQAENDFGIEVTGPTGTGGASPRVYGLGKMAAYNILPSGIQSFYLAQIDKTAAGKTLEIDLFDPGDVGGNAYLRILSPDGNAYNYAEFNYTTFNLNTTGSNCIAGRSDACSGTNRTTLQTAKSGSSSFNNTWVRILIPLDSTYGAGGLTPPGETQPGWWKIEYNVQGGNDTTTWMVNIRGNPVHLVVP